MKLRTIVLLATLISICNLKAFSFWQDVENTFQQQPLAQFTMDVIMNVNLNAGIDTLKKYKTSDKFYTKEREFFNVGQLLYRQGKERDALKFMVAVNEEFPELNKSLAQNLFMMIVKDGAMESQKWLEANKDYNEYYLDEGEFDMATTSFLKANNMAECKVINTVYLNEYPHNQEAHFQMADICYSEGNEKLALQYFRSGVATEDYISFSKLASDPLSIYVPTVLSSDTTSLFKVAGNPARDTAWIFVQGGPMPDISAYYPEPLTLLPEYEKLLKINVLQSQMINQTILSSESTLTDEQYLYEHNISSEMLNRTVRYFKNQGKTVFVIGHSYGAYICYDYLYTKDDQSDKLIIMASDLDEDLTNYEMNEDGSRKFIRYRDGITPYESQFWGNFTMEKYFKPKLTQIFMNTGSLVASHGKRRFTKLLNGSDLSNVIFYHAKFDEANGRTNKSDLNFWRGHGAQTIESYGDHHSMVTKKIFENIYNHLTSGTPLKRSVASTISDQIDDIGISLAIKNYNSYKDQENYFPIAESEINTLGYQLIAAGKMEEAIKVFQLNVDVFPNSWNTNDSLGETYMAMGNSLMGKIFYRKSLQIHPGNIYAIMALSQ